MNKVNKKESKIQKRVALEKYMAQIAGVTLWGFQKDPEFYLKWHGDDFSIEGQNFMRAWKKYQALKK